MLFNRIKTLVCCTIISTCAFSQTKAPKVKFGDINPEDFKPQFYTIDSSADAVYLYDEGSAYYESGAAGGLYLIYKEHKRIRLLNKKSFNEAATEKIYLFNHGYNSDEMEDLQAATFTMENGKVIETKVDKSSIFKTKEPNGQVITFVFPNLNEGCIVEYSYTEKISVFSYIPSWSFQNSYPHLWSEYAVEIPQFLDFVTLTNGYLQPAIDTGSFSASNFTIAGHTFRGNTVKHTWAFQNVPSIKEETYITNLSNYEEQVEFQLQALRIPGEAPKFFMSDWSETVDQLMKNANFGQDLSKENSWLKNDINPVMQKQTDVLAKAKEIYKLVRDNYNCINHSAILLWQPIKKTYDTKKGNVTDINMLLIAMLRYAGYTTDPVLLSTREHGKTYDVYPILSKYNYIVARLQLEGNTYLLDATDKNTGFGFLPPNCYNGNAIVITQPPLPIDLSSDSLSEKNMITLFLTNNNDGTISGSYKSVMGQVESYNLRHKLSSLSAEEYLKGLKSKFISDVDIKNFAVDSLKLPQEPVSIEYDINLKLNDDRIYFNPMLAEAEEENPFHASERLYPVEMPYCIDKVYIFNMEIPVGYKVDELPKPVKVTLNQNDGMFEYIIEQTNDKIQLQCRLKLNRANFEAEDYKTLRDFFSIVVAKESEQIVFEKQ